MRNSGLWNWFNKQPRKRVLTHGSRLTFCAAESLEQRAMMSAVMDNGAEAAEVGHVETHKAAVSYPNVAGNWLFQVQSSVINLTDFPVSITQNGAKYTITGSANGYSLSFNGKFQKSSPTTSTGKGTFDVPQIGTVKASFTTDASQDGSSIMGFGSVSTAGQSVNFDISGSKQLGGAPVQTANAVETHKKPTNLIPNLAGNWSFGIFSMYGDNTLNGSLSASNKTKTDFKGSGSFNSNRIDLNLAFEQKDGVVLPKPALIHISLAELGEGKAKVDEYSYDDAGTMLSISGSVKFRNLPELVTITITGTKM